MRNSILLTLLVVVIVGAAVYGLVLWQDSQKRANYSGNYPSYNYDYGPAAFKDDVATNFQANPEKLQPTFLDLDGNTIRLGDYRTKKNVALIIMRGLTRDPGGICPTCSTQTSRLIANHAEFVKRDTEVLVIFPGEKAQLSQFVEHVRSANTQATLPFPILLDENFQVIDQLGIRGDAAKPSTFLFDKQGQMLLAYVGATTTDRPSLKAMFKTLDASVAGNP